MSKCNISNKISKICETAKNTRLKSNMPMRLGACVVYKGKVCSTGFNHTNRSYISGYTFPSIHAEMSAVSSFVGRVSYRSSPHKKVWREKGQ